LIVNRRSVFFILNGFITDEYSLTEGASFTFMLAMGREFQDQFNGVSGNLHFSGVLSLNSRVYNVKNLYCTIVNSQDSGVVMETP